MQHKHPGPTQGHREKAVFRNLAIPVSAFDHIKDTQRTLQQTFGQPVSLNETVAHIVHQHRQQTRDIARTQRRNDCPAVFLPSS